MISDSAALRPLETQDRELKRWLAAERASLPARPTLRARLVAWLRAPPPPPAAPPSGGYLRR